MKSKMLRNNFFLKKDMVVTLVKFNNLPLRCDKLKNGPKVTQFLAPGMSSSMEKVTLPMGLN